jgi:hypothetical protein
MRQRMSLHHQALTREETYMAHKHTVWSLVHDTDGGTYCHLFGTEEERDARCSMIMAEEWSRQGRTAPLPADWRDAWEEIEANGCDFWVVLDVHEVALP